MPVRDDYAPGDAGAVERTAGGIQGLSQDFGEAYGEMARVQRSRDDTAWWGMAALQFSIVTEALPPDLRSMADAHRDVADALKSYARRLRDLQHEVDRALGRRAEAVGRRDREDGLAGAARGRHGDLSRQLWTAQRTRDLAKARVDALVFNPLDDAAAAHRALSSAQATVNAVSQARHEAWTAAVAHERNRDAAAADIGAADRQLESHKQDRRGAEGVCARAIRDALPRDLKNRSNYEKVRDRIGDGVDRLMGAVGDLADDAADFAVDLGRDIVDLGEEAGERLVDLGEDAIDFAVDVGSEAFNRYVVPTVVRGGYVVADTFFDARERLTGEREGRTGDLGGTYERRPNGTFSVTGKPEERGRDAVISALDHSADGARIQQDEFEIIDHGNGCYTVVLPGVTDLSRPEAGLDGANATVRDTDYAAARSAASTSIKDNAYARMVEESLRRYFEKIPNPPPPKLMIVGHSFGADTALDLASDPEFTREYDVTHVVAVAYNSQPQLPHVQQGTEVLVLQNNADVAVKAERMGHAGGSSGAHEATVRQFDGGGKGSGHHQDNYNDYLRGSSGDADLAAYDRSIADAGYTGSGSSVAVDVSVH